MKLRMFLVAVASFAALLLGCGDSDTEEPLVRESVRGDFDFRLGEPVDPKPVFTVDSEITVERDGHGTVVAEGQEREFELTLEQLRDLEYALARLDLDELESDFGPRPNEGKSFRVEITHDGRTAVLGKRIAFASTSKAAEAFGEVEAILVEASRTPEERRVDAQRREKLDRLRACLESGKPRERCVN